MIKIYDNQTVKNLFSDIINPSDLDNISDELIEILNGVFTNGFIAGQLRVKEDIVQVLKKY